MRILTLVLSLPVCWTAFGQTPDAVIQVDAAKVLHAIPRTIYGTFLEPIGHSTYGGLWAQILENPSFEENLWSPGRIAEIIKERPELEESSTIGLPLPWESLDRSQGRRFEPRWGDTANSSRSLLIMALPGKQTGVRQEVYLPVHRVTRYTGSLYAKPVAGRRDLEISLRRRNRAEEIFARQTVRLTSDVWTRYEFSLDIPRAALAGREAADFVVAASDEARILIDQVFLFPADHMDGLNPEMVQMARALKTPLVRFGGNFASGYHWRDGVGPIDKRPSILNQAWEMPEYNHFGTDEFLRFCQLIGAEPQIAMNLGSGTAEEAADWVRYVNSKWGDGSGGLLWEMGNELYHDFEQLGYPTLERVADRTREFSNAVRKVDPRIRLIGQGSCFSSSCAIPKDPYRDEYVAAELRSAPAAFDYLSAHAVLRPLMVRKTNPSREFLAQEALALPAGLEREFREMTQHIDGEPRARGRVKIAFTEWLFLAPGNGVPMYENLGGALGAAGVLNTLMRVADITPIADMTGLIEFGGIWQKRGRVYGVPAYWAFRMYSNADAAKLLETRTDVGQYDIEDGLARMPTIHGVPYLDVVSTLNESGDKLTLFCVNRHLTRDLHASIKISGFETGSGHGQQLTSTSLYSVNDEVRPDAVIPAEVDLKVKGSAFEHVFPKTSVTVIELTRQ